MFPFLFVDRSAPKDGIQIAKSDFSVKLSSSLFCSSPVGELIDLETAKTKIENFIRIFKSRL